MSHAVTTRALQVGDVAPDFIALSTAGVIHFHDWIGQNWCLVVSHVADFDEVCTTEVAEVARMQREFDRRGVLVVGVSTDGIDTHRRWAATISERHRVMPRFPLIADTDTTVSRRYGMLRHGTGPHADAHARSAFVIGPDKQIELSLSYPLTTGRNFWEILRVIDSLQLAARSRVATPANWQPGEDVVMRSVVDRAAATAVGAVS